MPKVVPLLTLLMIFTAFRGAFHITPALQFSQLYFLPLLTSFLILEFQNLLTPQGALSPLLAMILELPIQGTLDSTLIKY